MQRFGIGCRTYIFGSGSIKDELTSFGRWDIKDDWKRLMGVGVFKRILQRVLGVGVFKRTGGGVLGVVAMNE